VRPTSLILAMLMSLAHTGGAPAQPAASDRVPEQGEGAACPPMPKRHRL
jgi:hypothetical protein